MVERALDLIERTIVEEVVRDCVADGIPEEEVRRAVERRLWPLLREGRTARLATAKQMLAARATSVQ
jgi:hypothetical protein